MGLAFAINSGIDISLQLTMCCYR